jgi:tetratricopeptide (TPR) repeat protein
MIRGQSPANRHMALLAAAIFAVHPVHTEVVNSIFNRSDMLVALSGLAGLCWLLRHLHARPALAWTGLCIAFSVALFCKESGLVLPGLAVAVVLAVTPGDWLSRARKCLPVFWSLIPLALYFALRAQALAPVQPDAGASVAELAPAVDVMLETFNIPGGRRLLHVAGLWYESFRILVWPVPLSVYHGPTALWSGVAGLVLHLALVPLVIYQLRHRRYGLVLGLVFFHIALLPASRIIGGNALPHLAERYLYFPSVGAAIALAFGLAAAARRIDGRWLTAATAGAVMALAPITITRNAVWSSDVKLFESEYRNGNASERVLVWLTAAHLKQQRYARPAELCDNHVYTQKRSGKLSTHCAIAYSQLGRHEEAERAYLFGTKQRSVKAMAHANLARFYLDRGRRQDAREHFEAAIAAETLPANKAYRRGHMLVRLYPRDRQKLLEAKAQFELALELQPAFGPARQWLSRVNRSLGAR